MPHSYGIWQSVDEKKKQRKIKQEHMSDNVICHYYYYEQFAMTKVP